MYLLGVDGVLDVLIICLDFDETPFAVSFAAVRRLLSPTTEHVTSSLVMKRAIDHRPRQL